jgi:uncharacterized lipoprotein YmbA
MTARRILLCFALTLAFTGCGFFSKKPNHFYSLDTIPPAAGATALGAAGNRTMPGGVPIGIDGIELPPGLDRRGIVTRGADHQVQIAGTHEWAAPLEDMVIHTLAFDLANRLPEGMVVLPGQAKPGAMRTVYVIFEDLAPGPDNVFVLDARWTLTRGDAPDVTRHERITVNMTSGEPAAIAAAMSQALATLAERMLGELS